MYVCALGDEEDMIFSLVQNKERRGYRDQVNYLQSQKLKENPILFFYWIWVRTNFLILEKFRQVQGHREYE
jgi:hypothetical protein